MSDESRTPRKLQLRKSPTVSVESEVARLTAAALEAQGAEQDREQRIQALEVLLAASEARAAQWQADAESYRVDATVAQDRLAALKAKVEAALKWADDGLEGEALAYHMVETLNGR